MGEQPKPAGDVSGVYSDSVRNPIIQTGMSLEAPPNIIGTPNAARTIYYNYRTEHLRRIQLYAAIEGLISGNPPYNPIELQQHGLAHIANFNNLDARGLYERAALAYWNLLNEAETIATFKINNHDFDSDPNNTAQAKILSYHFDEVIRSWPSFYTLVNSMTGQLVKFGVSPIFWPDERDWRWRTIELQRFFVQDQAQADVQYLTAVCVESIFTAQYLFEIYNKFKDKPADSSPWDMNELEYLLLMRANSSVKNNQQVWVDLMDLQRRLQNGDLSWNDTFTDEIRLISLFYQEYDGKISHYMFDKFFDKGKFLYFVDKQYDAMEEALVIFTASPGEFTIHSNRGLGHKIFSGSQATMQLDCSIVDAARWSSTPLLQSLATGAKDLETIRFYPGVPTNIGSAEFVQNTMGANINQLIGASQFIAGKMSYNLTNSGDDPSLPDKNQGSISPSQARAQSYKEFGVLKNNIAHFYSLFDIVIRQMVIKMLKSKKGYPGYEYVLAWKEKCIADGVPPEVFSMSNVSYTGLPKQLSVKATRVAGDGSTLARIMGIESMAPFLGMFGPKAQKEVKREIVQVFMGKDYVEAMTQDDRSPDETAGGASLAAVENAVMQMGQSPVFSPDNEQQAHIVTHLALGNNVIRQIQQQQMDAIAADKVFTTLVPHLSEHVAFYAKNPFAQPFIDQIKKPFEQLREYAALNRKNAASQIQAQIKKQQQDQEATQQVLNDEQRKNVQLQGEEKRKDIKVTSQVERAKEASDTRAEIQRTKVEKDAENQRLKIRLESQNKSVENKPTEELRGDLDSINGASIAPYDLEGVEPV